MAQGARGPRLGSTARWVIGGLVVVLVAWILVSGVVMWSARQHVNDGLDALERARTAIDEDGLARGSAREDFAAAEDTFADANSLAGGPLLAPWSILPLASGNVRSVESSTAAAERVAAVGAEAAGKAREILDRHPSNGPERLALLHELAVVMRRAERSLRTLDLGPDFFLVGPLGEARERFVERFEELRSSLDDAAAAAEGVERLMRGPRKYLVLAANNAEMRGGSGMLLSAGVATFEDGVLSLGEMRPTPDFNLPTAAVTVPEDLQRLWGWTPIGRDWRWLATSPRFDVNAPLAADMWQAATGERVDGVLAVDPLVVQSLLDAQGPIEVDGRRLSADDVLQFLLLDQYTFADAADPEQAGRRDQLSSVARSAIDTLSQRVWNPGALARTLTDAGRGRHILAWSRDQVEERTWKRGGIGGDLQFDSLAVSILNTGGNKLDPFLEVDARLTVADRPDGDRNAMLALQFENKALTNLPAYVAGPHPATDLTTGEYQGVVAVNSPGVGSLPALAGLETILVTGRDGPTKVVAAGPLRLKPGEATEVMVRFVLPEQLRTMVVEPSARIPAMTWRYRGERWLDTHPHTVDLD